MLLDLLMSLWGTCCLRNFYFKTRSMQSLSISLQISQCMRQSMDKLVSVCIIVCLLLLAGIGTIFFAVQVRPAVACVSYQLVWSFAM